MKVYVKFDIEALCKAALNSGLEDCDISYSLNSSRSEITLSDNTTPEKLLVMSKKLAQYGIEVLDDKKAELTQRIKDQIHQMLLVDGGSNLKISIYLSENLGYSYSYLSKIFSQTSYTSIEHYVILKKLDRVKEFLVKGDLSLTEIAHMLNYSSVAHLSNQFKKNTGITPSVFSRIVQQRKELAKKETTISNTE